MPMVGYLQLQTHLASVAPDQLHFLLAHQLAEDLNLDYSKVKGECRAQNPSSFEVLRYAELTCREDKGYKKLRVEPYCPLRQDGASVGFKKK